MDSLDAASLRRFDFKIKFDYLQPKEAWALFDQVLKENGGRIGKNRLVWKKRLEKLDNLTPGDFATVVRQYRVTGQSLDAKALFAALEQESLAKPGANGRSIGFIPAH